MLTIYDEFSFIYGFIMSVKVEVSLDTFKRLEGLAVGFDSPESVINRLIDKYSNAPISKPKISFFPSDEKKFLSGLVKSRVAEIALYKADGTREILHWKASKISINSNLRGNLWSGFLRGWQEKGIVEAELSLLPVFPSVDESYDSHQHHMELALELGLKLSELKGIEGEYEIDEVSSSDGLVYYNLIKFDQCVDENIIKNINGLSDDRTVRVSPSIFG